MLTGSLAGAAGALVVGLVFVTRPRLAFGAAHLFERAGQGRSDAVLRLFAAFGVLGALIGAAAAWA